MAEATDAQAHGGAVAGMGTSNGHDDGQARDEGGNKFQQAVSAWRSLDLTTLVSNLDPTAAELVAYQKDSLIQRKELAQKTKAFRKLDDASKLNEVKDLLKAYQSYVDVLTTHNKAVHAGFMKAYSPLSEAPDPYPLLEASVDSLVTAEEVTPRLEKENKDLKKQNEQLHKQLEENERSLGAERDKRVSFEGAQDNKIKEVEESWSAVLKEKEDNWTSKERNFEEKVEGQEKLLRELKASYEVSQRLEQSGEEPSKAESNDATSAELAVVSSELDRANSRLADIEARNEKLRVELAQAASQSRSSGRSAAVEDDPGYLRLRTENQSLLRRLDSARYEKEAEKSGLESRLRTLERDTQALRSDRDAATAKLQRWSDYEEVKRELEMLRAVEFATVADSDLPEPFWHDGEAADGDGRSGESLEHLLLARNKKLSTELTELRVAHNEMQPRFQTLQETVSGVNKKLEQSQSLNAKLERDLENTQREASSAFETMSVAGTWTSRYPSGKSTYGSRRGDGASPTSSIIGGFDPSGSSSPREMGGGGNTGQGILPMVTAQRDRFKKKMAELEAELQKQYQLVASLRGEVSSLQKDNLNLYEKTRYVSSYSLSRPTATSSSAAYGANPNPSTIAMSSPSEDRYRSAYEHNISPFAAFRTRESARAVKRMRIPERAVFQLSCVVLATRTSRNLFAAYCLGLHVLVLTMLWWMASTDVQRSASGLSAATGPGVVGAAAGIGQDAGPSMWDQPDFEGQ